MSFLLIVFLTLLNSLFAMSEMALASSRKSRLFALAEEGNKGAKAALKLMDDPTQFLSSIQVGITSISMLSGILGEAAFSEGLSLWLQSLGVPDRGASISATAIVVTTITFFTIVFGELVPKRIGQLHPETMACWVARPMMGVAIAAKPFVRLLSVSTQAVLKILRIKNDVERTVTEEEITASLNEGLDAGLIEETEHQMVQNVFRLDDRPLTSLMTPRTDIEWLDVNRSALECLEQIGQENQDMRVHSWYPVCKDSLDDVLGIISVAQLLVLANKNQDKTALLHLKANHQNQKEGNLPISQKIAEHIQHAVFLPETLSGMELLDQFRAHAVRMVFVVDEYGVLQGLMTPRDLLEAITGELKPNAQTDAWAIQREDGSWLLDGVMPIDELKSRLDIRQLPEEQRGRYNTLAGLLMLESGHLPSVGEKIESVGWIFEIIDLDGKRIDKVLAFQKIEK